MLKYIITAILTALTISAFVGCASDPGDPGMEYAPNMFHSIPPEPFSQQGKNDLFPDGLSSQKPPEGTIPRGENWYKPEEYVPYHLEGTNGGYDSAVSITNPLECNETTMEEGKKLYAIFCEVCHGKGGLGDGNIAKREKIIPPSYKSDAVVNLPAGKIFHSLTYGKNLMGSYASQLTPKERWQVVCYVQYLQKN